MSQVGNFTPILLYSTTNNGVNPLAINLTNNSKGSELAINIGDGRLFYKTNIGNIRVISRRGWSGTVTSVTGTNPIISNGSTTTPAISLATNYGDTQNPYGVKTANHVLAAPNGTSGAPTFRALVLDDIPAMATLTAGTNITFSGGTTYNGKTNITINATGGGGGGGTVTEVTGSAGVVNVINGTTTPAISLATNYGDNQNPYANKTANHVLAAPTGTSGAPTFRALVAADIPAMATLTAGTNITFSGGTTYDGKTNITINATGGGGGGGTVTEVTGTSPVQVTSGTTTPVISLAPNYAEQPYPPPYTSKSAGYVLAAPASSSGTPVFRALVASDIPTLNQNTTGTTANVSGVVEVPNGGTGLSYALYNCPFIGLGALNTLGWDSTFTFSSNTLTVYNSVISGLVGSEATYTPGQNEYSVYGASYIGIYNLEQTIIIKFLDATEGQILTCYFSDANTAIGGIHFHLRGGVLFYSSDKTTLTLIYTNGIWVELARSINA
jgi:hypothetical protein